MTGPDAVFPVYQRGTAARPWKGAPAARPSAAASEMLFLSDRRCKRMSAGSEKRLSELGALYSRSGRCPLCPGGFECLGGAGFRLPELLVTGALGKVHTASASTASFN